MYRQIVRFYVFVLTLLEISLNSKLTAQGKSHGVIHDPLISDGITFQEWGKDSSPGGAAAATGAGGGEGAGAGGGEGILSLSPPALHFGHASLGAAHALTVVITNTANTTMHLASVAGTTPDFHASFFDAKTLPPNGNTSFSVVYVGRHEGAVAAHLYIHTSLGVYKYSVSAVGVASAWGVWPLVEVVVPRGAAVAPLLTLTNPTDTTVQVVSVYSSAGWLGLELPEGGGWATRSTWTLPPRATRPLVRLRMRPHSHTRTLTAYIRIKTEAAVAAPLVVCVSARAAPPGPHADPLQLRAGLRGHRDTHTTYEVSLGNSAPTALQLQAAVTEAHCAPLDLPPPAPSPAPSPADTNGGPLDPADANGGTDAGAKLKLLTTHIEANSQLKKAATITLDYGKMWSSYVTGGGSRESALCTGVVRLGDTALPYSALLLYGTLVTEDIHVVTGREGGDVGGGGRAVRVRNEFTIPLRVTHITHHQDILKYFHVSTFKPTLIPAGDTVTLQTLRLRISLSPSDTPLEELTLQAQLFIHTNVTVYPLTVLVYSGKVLLEWRWSDYKAGSSSVPLGTVCGGCVLTVPLLVSSPAPRASRAAPLCLSELVAVGDHAAITPPRPPDACIPPGGQLEAQLTIHTQPQPGELHVVVRVSTQHATVTHTVTAHVQPGSVRARDVILQHCAPWVRCSSPLWIDSSMAISMHLLDVQTHTPQLTHTVGERCEISSGVSPAGEVNYWPELSDDVPHYTGLDLNTTDGAAWLRRLSDGWSSLAGDVDLVTSRLALYHSLQSAVRVRNYTFTIDTSQVKQIPVSVSARVSWPRLVEAAEGAGPGAGWAGTRGVGSKGAWRVIVRNPSRAPLLLHPLLHDHIPLSHTVGGTESPSCAENNSSCVTSPGAFTVLGWEVEGAGQVGEGRGEVLVPAGGEAAVKLLFTPLQDVAHHAYLYLRNNLTILEVLEVSGVGAHPSFELSGRKPGSTLPILLEVTSCSGRPVSAVVALVNTGAVPVTVLAVRVSARHCVADGFSVTTVTTPPTPADHTPPTCPQPFVLAPNRTHHIQVAFTTDWTLSRVRRPLAVETEEGAALYLLEGAVPARLLAECGPEAKGGAAPAWEGGARGAAALAALLGAGLVLALAVLDSEAVLRRAMLALHRAPPGPSAAGLLDLRALNHMPPAPAPPPAALPCPPAAPAPRRKRSSRQRERKDPFRHWKLSSAAATCALLEDESSRSSAEELEQGEAPAEDGEPPTGGDEEDEEEDPPRDEDTHSTATDSTTSSERSPPSPARRSPPTAAACPPPAASPPPACPAAPPRPPRPHATPTRRHDDPSSQRPRPLLNKFHGKKEKGSKRRAAAPSTGGVTSQAPPSPVSSEVSRPPGPLPAPSTAPASVRRGATFSEVVARADTLYSSVGTPPPAPSPAPPALPAPRPLAPIGSDLRKRSSPEGAPASFLHACPPPSRPAPSTAPAPAPAPAADHSLFYFSGEVTQTPDGEARAWDSPARPHRYLATHAGPDAQLRTHFNNEDSNGLASEFGPTLRSSLWSSGDNWSWTYSEPLRPPPGFAPPSPIANAAPPALPASPVRAFDPFHALAAIWATDRPAWADTSPPSAADPPAPHRPEDQH